MIKAAPRCSRVVGTVQATATRASFLSCAFSQVLYLAGVQDSAAVPVTVVSNAANVGFPAAINQGLQLARGEYLVMLNNDVVVTDAWLDQLIALAEIKIDSRAEADPPPYPPPQGGRHLNAQANVERNCRDANLNVVDINGGDPVVVDGSIDGLFPDPASTPRAWRIPLPPSYPKSRVQNRKSGW
jgi:glycosyltransferase involved in cell wall biosynthesis